MFMLLIYLNLATPNNKVRHPSRKLLKDTCKVAATFGAKGVVVHGGSVGEGGDIDEGYKNWGKALKEVEDTGMRVLVRILLVEKIQLLVIWILLRDFGKLLDT